MFFSFSSMPWMPFLNFKMNGAITLRMVFGLCFTRPSLEKHRILRLSYSGDFVIEANHENCTKCFLLPQKLFTHYIVLVLTHLHQQKQFGLRRLLPEKVSLFINQAVWLSGFDVRLVFIWSWVQALHPATHWDFSRFPRVQRLDCALYFKTLFFFFSVTHLLIYSYWP